MGKANDKTCFSVEPKRYNVEYKKWWRSDRKINTPCAELSDSTPQENIKKLRMNSFMVLCLFGLVAVAVARPGGQYTNKYDNVDLNQILSNRRLLTPYVKCMLDQGKCTPEGKELKSHVREALAEDCAKCTETQRNGTRQVMAHLINHEVEYWNQLKAKYDPQSKYSKKHEQELRNLKQ